MKALLCLLSAQHVPNLLSVHHFKPDRLVLVESREMQAKKAAEHFRRALQLGGLEYSDEMFAVEHLDAEDDLGAVRACLQRAFDRLPADDWIANVTGGTKPMSIAAFEFFKTRSARLIYFNLSRPDEILPLDGQPVEKCDYRPSILEFLAGYGFQSSKSEQHITEAETRAHSWWPCAKRIAENASEQLLLRFGNLDDPEVKKRRDVARNKGLRLESGHLMPEPRDLRDDIANSFSLTDTAGGLLGQLNKYAVEFLTGGWLEVFVWGLIARHADALGVWNVRLGVKPAKIGAVVDNDFDVAFMHGFRLCMVECKSGAQSHDSGADVLHKVEAVVRQFRALGVRSCLATTSSNVLDKDGALKPSIRDRAAVYQCAIVVRDQLRELARSPENVELVRSVFLNNRPT